MLCEDIKPSNILCNSQGEIKLCDFGVSGELINSIAHTFVGTSIYMSVRLPPTQTTHYSNKPPSQPERIQGAEYSVKSDVWSLGISLIELALGRFPFSDSYDGPDDDLSDLEDEHDLGKTATNRDSLMMQSEKMARRISRRRSKGVSLHGGGMTMSIIELMHQIVKEPAPRLGPEGRFAKEAEEFVDACLLKDPDDRKPPKTLLVRFYAWVWLSEAHSDLELFLDEHREAVNV